MADSHSRQSDIEVRKAQATLMVAQRVQGASLTDIGRHFGVSPQTVNNRLQLAKEMGLIEEYRTQVLEDLIPLAIEAFKGLLQEGNYDAARDVLQGMGVIPKPGSNTLTVKTEEISLEQWRAGRHEPSRGKEDDLLHPSGGNPEGVREATLLGAGEDSGAASKGAPPSGDPPDGI